jgi:hypothetical protein
MWAGQFRTVNISKGGHLFGAAAFIQSALHDVLQKLGGERYLRVAIRRGESISTKSCSDSYRTIDRAIADGVPASSGFTRCRSA